MTGVAQLIATVGGVGYLRPAPGTWGSLAALPLAWALHGIGGFPILCVGVALCFAVGVWATDVVTRDATDHDPSEIVIDEVAGQWIALMPLSYASWTMGLEITRLWPGWIAAFILFRVFDITKPWLVGWADRRADAIGVMLDDVFAGLFAALGVLGLGGLAHGVMGV